MRKSVLFSISTYLGYICSRIWALTAKLELSSIQSRRRGLGTAHRNPLCILMHGDGDGCPIELDPGPWYLGRSTPSPRWMLVVRLAIRVKASVFDICIRGHNSGCNGGIGPGPTSSGHVRYMDVTWLMRIRLKFIMAGLGFAW